MQILQNHEIWRIFRASVKAGSGKKRQKLTLAYFGDYVKEQKGQ